MPPSASILVVNFNSGCHLETCVESLKTQTCENFEVIILDNASGDDSLKNAKRAIGDDLRFLLIEGNKNLGFAKGNNQAAEHARADWIITLNPDAFPDNKWLENLLEAARAHPQIVHFGSTQYVAHQPKFLDGAGDRYFMAGIPWRDRSTTRIDFARAKGQNTFESFSACAAAAMYRADILRAIGGFDERFFCFVEDVDLGFRLRLQGHPCIQVMNALVAHVGGGAGGGESDFARFYGTRNLIWCFAKNMPLPMLLGLSPALFAVLILLVLKAVPRGNTGTILNAIAAAVAGMGPVWRDRPKSAGERCVPIRSIAAAMDWNPFAYLKTRRS
jgi:N-acetylglucosaminyl-diphospho-decaprenol L-rhamnosyltransferase